MAHLMINIRDYMTSYNVDSPTAYANLNTKVCNQQRKRFCH